MKNFKFMKVSRKVKTVLAWLNVREKINEYKYKLNVKAYNEAGNELNLLYHATIGKIYTRDEPLEDIAQWYNDEKIRIHTKYGFKSDLTDGQTFNDIYNDYCITNRVQSRNCCDKSDQDFFEDDTPLHDDIDYMF